MIRTILAILLCASLCNAADFRQVVGYSHGGGSSGPTEIASDNFNRADSQPIGSPWITAPSQDGGLKIVSNTVRGISGTKNAAYYNATFSGDQYAELKLVGSYTNIGPAVRISSSAQTLIFAFVNSGGSTCGVAKYVSGTYSAISSSFSCGFVDGDTIRLESNGNSVTVKINGVQKYNSTTAASDVSGGNPGVRTYGTTGVGDDWRGGDL